MKSLFPKYRSRRGLINQTFVVLTVLVGISGYLGTMTVQRNIQAKKRQRDAKFDLVMHTGVESLLVAYRLAEIRYVTALSSANCSNGAPFLQALKSGSGCAGLAQMTFFSSADSTLSDLVFDYSGSGCTVKSDSSTCGSGEHELIDMGATSEAKRVDGVSYKFFLTAVQPTKQIVEFVTKITHHALGTTSRRSFGIRPTFVNAAHIETDGRVTQENPDPLARCEGSAWADYLYFDEASRKCMQFAQLGGGTGLVYYLGRYFGFRPDDRRFMDLADSTGTGSLFVDPATGISGVGGKFLPYDPDTLLNVDDLTTIDDQLYYVGGSGAQAHIGLVQGTVRTKVCDLGAMEFGQPYVGIAALSWSDPLKPSGVEAVAPTTRFAVFALKTDLGGLLTAVVQGTAAGAPYSCYVFKDQNAQVDEYQRTYGFDRTSDSKPYFIY